MEFVQPDVRFHESFVAAIREIHTLDPTPPPFAQFDITGITTPDAFGRYVDALVAEQFEETPRPADHVPQTTLWWVDGDEFVGRLAIRHRLTPSLRKMGGHIGYDVRPSRRREGHAARMLASALPIAASLGLEEVLLTCDTDNVASRKVIEKNGGVLEDELDGRLRFWISVGSRSSKPAV
jgi:predicted acetyltransferase